MYHSNRVLAVGLDFAPETHRIATALGEKSKEIATTVSTVVKPTDRTPGIRAGRKHSLMSCQSNRHIGPRATGVVAKLVD